MTDRELHGFVEWVMANLPTVAMRGPEAVQRIVKQAIKETVILRILLAVVGAVVGAGIGAGILEYLPGTSVSRRSYTIVVSVCAGLAAYVASIASEILVHRRIGRIAEQS